MTGNATDGNSGSTLTPTSTPNEESVLPSGALPPGVEPKAIPVKTWEIKVNGETQKLTEEQMIERAQKGTAAEARFQEAALAKKEASDALEIRGHLEKVLKEGDTDAFRAIGEKVGMSSAEIEEGVKAMLAAGGDEDEDQGKEEPKGKGGEKGSLTLEDVQKLLADRDGKKAKVSFADLADDVQSELVGTAVGRINRKITEALDTDEEIRYYMRGKTEEEAKVFRQLVDGEIKGRLNETKQSFGDGTQVLAHVLPKVKTYLKAFGTPSTSPVGLGPNPGGGELNVYPQKEPEHVSSTSFDFDQHILETIAFNQVQADLVRG